VITPAHLHQPLSVAQLRERERQALALGLPLMQRAGHGAAQFVQQQCPRRANILILVGPGNNGGDALVAARVLAEHHALTVVMPQAEPNAPTDAREALAHWLASGGVCQSNLASAPPQLVIDGLFGIGLTRPLSAPWQAIIDQVNAWQVPTLALDVPSGVEADTGQLLGQPIKAHWTLSFIAPSLASAMPQTEPYFGQCWVEDLQLNHA